MTEYLIDQQALNLYQNSLTALKRLITLVELTLFTQVSFFLSILSRQVSYTLNERLDFVKSQKEQENLNILKLNFHATDIDKMDFLPQELSLEQANTMKSILDQQLALIQNEKKEDRTVEKRLGSFTPNYQENEYKSNEITSDILQLQSKIQDLESKLNRNGENQGEKQVKVRKKQDQSQLSNRQISTDRSHRSGSRSKSRQIRDAAYKRIESSEQFLDALERSFTPSIHSDASKHSKLITPRQTSQKKSKSRQQTPNKSFSDLKNITRLKQELASERSQRIKAQKDLNNLQHTLKVKQNIVNQFTQLQNQYNDLYLQLERSEKIRVQQKDLIVTLKEELILLREENGNLMSKETFRTQQQESPPAKKKKIRKGSKK